MNPPETGFTIEESLNMGSRHTATRVKAGVTYVTTIELLTLEPAPPTFEVRHAAFREEVPGELHYCSDESRVFDDLDEALAFTANIHNRDIQDMS